MKKIVIALVLLIVIAAFAGPASHLAVDMALKENNKTLVSDDHLYLDDFLAKEEQKTERLKKISAAMKAMLQVSENYFKFKNFKEADYERKDFFKCLDEMTAAFKHISFKETFEHNASRRRIFSKSYKFTRARSISRLVTLFSTVVCPDSQISAQQQNRDFIDDVEAILKYSSLIENSNRTLIEKMISVVMDKMAVKIVYANNRAKKLTSDQTERLRNLFEQRLKVSNDFKSVMMSEYEWSKLYLAPFYKKYPLRMKAYAMFYSDPLEDYKAVLDMCFKGASKEELLARMDKSCHLAKIMIPNFSKAKEKINKIHHMMASFEGDFEKSQEYRGFKPFEPLNNFGFNWLNFKFR